MNDVVAVVEVKQRYRRHLRRVAARTRAATGLRLRDYVCVRVLLEEHVATLARAEVRPVALRGDDPVPVELDEVNDERVATATLLRREVVALEAKHALRSRVALVDAHFYKRLLQRRSTTLETHDLCVTNATRERDCLPDAFRRYVGCSSRPPLPTVTRQLLWQRRFVALNVLV